MFIDIFVMFTSSEGSKKWFAVKFCVRYTTNSWSLIHYSLLYIYRYYTMSFSSFLVYFYGTSRSFQVYRILTFSTGLQSGYEFFVGTIIYSSVSTMTVLKKNLSTLFSKMNLKLIPRESLILRPVYSCYTK